MLMTDCFSICNILFFFFFFFFSSRRRHTRYIGDWSSDVCSSDLPIRETAASSTSPPSRRLSIRSAARRCRSEERRVGKECRSRWSPYHKKKKKEEKEKISHSSKKKMTDKLSKTSICAEHDDTDES